MSTSRIDTLQQLAQKSRKPLVHYGLAMELRSAGRLEEAIARFRIVHDIDAAYAAAYFMRAQVHVELGDTAAAREALTTGIGAARAGGDTHAAGEMSALLDTLDDD